MDPGYRGLDDWSSVSGDIHTTAMTWAITLRLEHSTK